MVRQILFGLKFTFNCKKLSQACVMDKTIYKHDWIFETTSVNNIFQNPLEGYQGLS